MQQKLVLDWNLNYLLYMLFLILLTGLTMFVISIIRLTFSLSNKVLGKNKKRNIKRVVLSYFLAFLVGVLNSIGIFFYMFSNIEINFIILTFIPVILIICICWSIRLSCVAALPSILTYFFIGIFYLKISFFDVLTPIFAFLIMFTGAFFCKVYNIQKYWQILLMQIIFSLICTLVMSTTLNSADNIYVIYNGKNVPLKDIDIFKNFSFYFVNIILVNLSSNLINLIIFMFFYWTTKKTEVMINNILVINNLSYYLDGVFVNNKIGLKNMKEEIKNDEFYLSISIFLPNLSSSIKGINYKDEKEIKSKIIQHLEHKFRKYNPIYYKNKWGFYCLLISLKEFDITYDLKELYENKNEKFNEIYDMLKNYVTTINYNNQYYPYQIKNFMSLYGIHTYDLNELEDISYRLYNEYKNTDQTVVLFNPEQNIISNDKIQFSDYPEIDKSKFSISFIANNTDANIIETNISYIPYLLITKNDLYDYLEKIDPDNKLKRYLALEVLRKFKIEHQKYPSLSIVIDYPEKSLIKQDIDVKNLVKKIQQLGYQNQDIIIKFSNKNVYEDFEFIHILKELKQNNIKIWLSDMSFVIFYNISKYVKIDYVSFSTNISQEQMNMIRNNSTITLLDNN